MNGWMDVGGKPPRMGRQFIAAQYYTIFRIAWVLWLVPLGEPLCRSIHENGYY